MAAAFAAGGMAAVILSKDPAKRKSGVRLPPVRHGSGGADAHRGEHRLYARQSGCPALLKDFYAQHPATATSATQIGRAFPWFGWPGRNGPRISQIVLDNMTAIANQQESSDGRREGDDGQIKAQLPQ